MRGVQDTYISVDITSAPPAANMVASFAASFHGANDGTGLIPTWTAAGAFQTIVAAIDGLTATVSLPNILAANFLQVTATCPYSGGTMKESRCFMIH